MSNNAIINMINDYSQEKVEIVGPHFTKHNHMMSFSTRFLYLAKDCHDYHHDYLVFVHANRLA